MHAPRTKFEFKLKLYTCFHCTRKPSKHISSAKMDCADNGSSDNVADQPPTPDPVSSDNEDNVVSDLDDASNDGGPLESSTADGADEDESVTTPHHVSPDGNQIS